MITLRKGIRSIKKLVQSRRAMSNGSLTSLTADDEGVATLTLQRPPVNSLNLDLLQEMDEALDEVAKNKYKALILTSSSSSVFSAGLDIMEFYKPELKRAELFWTTLQEVWLKLFESSFITAAAVNGYAPAGGCLLAMSCEYRAMVGGKYTIGLNETALGVVAPLWFMDVMRATIPARTAEEALTTGKMFTVEEALKFGLIDDVANDKDDAMNKCKGFIKKYDKIPPQARSATKQKYRAGITQRLKATRQEDIADFISLISNPQTQQSLETYIQTLKGKQR